jgi:hypothetical protein
MSAERGSMHIWFFATERSAKFMFSAERAKREAFA